MELLTKMTSVVFLLAIVVLAIAGIPLSRYLEGKARSISFCSLVYTLGALARIMVIVVLITTVLDFLLFGFSFSGD